MSEERRWEGAVATRDLWRHCVQESLLGTAPKEGAAVKVDPLCHLACVGRDIQTGAGEVGTGP